MWNQVLSPYLLLATGIYASNAEQTGCIGADKQLLCFNLGLKGKLTTQAGLLTGYIALDRYLTVIKIQIKFMMMMRN